MAKKKTSRRTAAVTDSPVFDQLQAIAGNLWWSWTPDAIDLFKTVNAEQFAASNRNPIVLLRKCTAAKRRKLEADTDFAKRVKKVHTTLQRYLRDKGWYKTQAASKVKGLTAYFSMEYGLTESLPLYAGGLGVLAGDHLKASSDLGVPLVAIGIYWHQGYAQQLVDKNGVQENLFPKLPIRDTPLVEVTTRTGKPLRIKVPLGKEIIVARALQLDVGRIPLYLLDTNLPENPPKHRKIVDTLYSGDRDSRIRQEILLGIGGWRLMRALKLPVAACHLNEGHAAFLSLERIAERMKDHNESFKASLRYVSKTSVFTTHTPVPAGNEAFDPKLVDQYFAPYQRKLGLTHEQFHDLARVKPGDTNEPYGLTPLALHTSKYANGVAALHGKVARGMWQDVFPTKTLANVPIGHVTNGIHLRTWIHPDMAAVYDNLFGSDWDTRQDQAAMWKRIDKLDSARLWEMHQSFKAELIEFCRTRLRDQMKRYRIKGMSSSDVDNILDPNALTIGFARRCVTYKRPTLIFNDAKRLAKILNHQKKPVQLIFAGKAHPADGDGQALIRDLVKLSRSAQFRNRVVFIENYDMNVARHMVAGVDIWLNNPQRPREASGTSGMKPALHGGLNFSILDGWWPEAYNRRNGWAIGKGQDHSGKKADDKRDVAELYRTLSKDIVPLYYARNAKDVPTKWISRMKNAIATIPVAFNSNRQVKEYLKKYYLPAMRQA